jgi:alanine racemase
MHGPAYRSWVEISRAQIAANFHAVRSTVGAAVEVLPVVKADAYGHGAAEVSRLLVGEGARWLAVSNVEEGAALRQSDIAARILVMADFLPATRLAMLEHDLTPVIHSLDEVPVLNQLAAGRGERARFHLKIDSGMCRLGTRATANEIGSILDDCPYVHLEGMMTHYASVTDFTGTQTEDQTGCFFGLVDRLQRIGIRPEYLHLASTGGIAYRSAEALGNMVRPGHAIYGYVSPARGTAPQSALHVHPVLTWKATVLSVKDIPKGSLVGYGGMFRAPHQMRIAVLAIGYADGLPHRISNRGRVIACGRYANILGAVSMDVTTIDTTDCPEIKQGDAVTILGRDGELKIDAQEIARQAGTISYSVLCGINSRVRRLYV